MRISGSFACTLAVEIHTVAEPSKQHVGQYLMKVVRVTIVLPEPGKRHEQHRRNDSVSVCCACCLLFAASKQGRRLYIPFCTSLATDHWVRVHDCASILLLWYASPARVHIVTCSMPEPQRMRVASACASCFTSLAWRCALFMARSTRRSCSSFVSYFMTVAH